MNKKYYVFETIGNDDMLIQSIYARSELEAKTIVSQISRKDFNKLFVMSEKAYYKKYC